MLCFILFYFPERDRCNDKTYTLTLMLRLCCDKVFFKIYQKLAQKIKLSKVLPNIIVLTFFYGIWSLLSWKVGNTTIFIFYFYIHVVWFVVHVVCLSYIKTNSGFIFCELNLCNNFGHILAVLTYRFPKTCLVITDMPLNAIEYLKFIMTNYRIKLKYQLASAIILIESIF